MNNRYASNVDPGKLQDWAEVAGQQPANGVDWGVAQQACLNAIPPIHPLL